MATSRDSPNPLRPYYIPPSIGPPPESISNGTSASTRVSASYPSSSLKPSFGSTARDYLSDIDYGDYLSDTSPSLAELAKRLMDQALWNYTSVLLAQPFEVAKTVLQVHLAAGSDAFLLASQEQKSRPSSIASGKFEDYPSDDDDDDSDVDSPSYFTSSAPRHGADISRSPEPRRRARPPNRSQTPTTTHGDRTSSHKIDLRKSDAVFEVIGQLWQKEGAFGVWKGTNSTFVYNFLLKTIENWSRSMLSALLNVPDAGLLGSLGSGVGGLDVVDSSNPIASLIVAVAAAGIAGLILSPLDMVRTRLILTPTSCGPRHIIPSLRALPSIGLPMDILPITLLHSTLPTLFSASSPIFFRSWLHIDPVLSPSTYSFSTFLSSTAELFLRLPLETVLRRGQIDVLKSSQKERDLRTSYNEVRRSRDSPETIKTVVDAGPYKGIFGTMWFIIREEGTSTIGPVSAASAQAHGRADSRRIVGKTKKGQGIYGLWRGWRVGFWGLAGVWSAAAFGGNAGGEF